VTDGSSEALADAVQALLASPEMRKTQAAAGLDAVRQQYSISAVVDELEAVYGRVIA
jgi:glycosyltransferase involved in cell wall biosynthesis